MARSRSPVLLGVLLSLAFAVLVRPLSADPASTLQTLMIVDQGNFISFQWSFYFVDFPPQFVLKENPSETVVLNDPATIEENVSKIVAVAFDLRIAGQPVRPDKISRLQISSNKVCTVTMIYRGKPGAPIELRAPVLQYLPSTALINYEILTLGQASKVVTGNLMGHPGPFPQVIDYRQVDTSNSAMPETESPFAVLFKAGLRMPWINSNWIFLTLLLFLVLKSPQAIGALFMVVAACVSVGLLAIGNVVFPWAVPEIIVGISTALLGVLASRPAINRFLLLIMACGAACLNAIHDLQPLRLGNEVPASSALTGLVFGFSCSMFFVGVFLFLIVGECRKNPEFSREWMPKICWVVAALALIFSLL